MGVTSKDRPRLAGQPLTLREVEVLCKHATGNTYESGARRLNIASATYRSHTARIAAKLGIGGDRAEMVQRGYSDGWLLLPGPQPASPDPLLSSREHRVMVLVAKGRTNLQIAEDMDTVEDTVKTWMRRILRTLGAVDRANAVHLSFVTGNLRLGPVPLRDNALCPF